MRTAGLLVLTVSALVLLFGCGLSGSTLVDTGSTVTEIGTVAGGSNPTVGIVLGTIGAVLTAVGEWKKRNEGR